VLIPRVADTTTIHSAFIVCMTCSSLQDDLKLGVMSFGEKRGKKLRFMARRNSVLALTRARSGDR
jgi:hypothetical protein